MVFPNIHEQRQQRLTRAGRSTRGGRQRRRQVSTHVGKERAVGPSGADDVFVRKYDLKGNVRLVGSLPETPCGHGHQLWYGLLQHRAVSVLATLVAGTVYRDAGKDLDRGSATASLSSGLPSR